MILPIGIDSIMQMYAVSHGRRENKRRKFFSVGKRRTCKRDAEIFVNGHYAADT